MTNSEIGIPASLFALRKSRMTRHSCGCAENTNTNLTFFSFARCTKARAIRKVGEGVFGSSGMYHTSPKFGLMVMSGWVSIPKHCARAKACASFASHCDAWCSFVPNANTKTRARLIVTHSSSVSVQNIWFDYNTILQFCKWNGISICKCFLRKFVHRISTRLCFIWRKFLNGGNRSLHRSAFDASF